MRSLRGLAAFVAVIISFPALADVGPDDWLALRQLQTVAAEPPGETSGSEIEILNRITSREIWAKDLAELLRAGKPLGLFEPRSWSAISPELCKAAGLGIQRCVSLTCLLPELNADDAKHCPSSSTPAANAELPPKDPAKLGDWLKKVGSTTQTTFKAELLRGELPVDPEIVTAKGVLHMIWPDLLDAARKVGAVRPENVQPLVAEVLQNVENRAAQAARVIAAARLIETLSMDGRKLVEPLASQFLTQAAKIDRAYKESLNGTSTSVSSLRAVESDLAAADQLLTSLGRQLAGTLKPKALETDPRVADCSTAERDDLRELAVTTIEGRRAAFALKKEKGPLNEGRWRLVAVLSPKENEKIKISQNVPGPDGKSVVINVDVEARCVASIIDLGIVIGNLEDRQGKLAYAGARNRLTQVGMAEQFTDGLNELLRQLGGQDRGIPATIFLDDPRLSFSEDLGNVDLLVRTTVPVLNLSIQSTFRLVENGKFALKSANPFDYARLFDAFKSVWTPTDVEVGPLTISGAALDLTGDSLRQNGTWLAVKGKLAFGKVQLGEATAYVVDRGGVPQLQLASDLTLLIRARIAEINAAGGMLRQIIGQSFSGLEQDALNEVARALYVDQVRLSADGKGVDIRLALDLPAIAGSSAPRIVAEGRLRASEADLGLGEVYKQLFAKALSDVANLRTMIVSRLSEKLGRSVQDATKAAIEDIVSKANAALRPLNVGLRFESSAKTAAVGVLRVIWEGESADLGTVTIIPSPMRIDFSGGQISEADGRRLGRKLEVAVMTKLKSLIGLAWRSCGEPRVARTSGGLSFQLSAEAPFLGCVPLPPIVFDGFRADLDVAATADALKPLLVEKVKLLIPADLREHILSVKWEPNTTIVKLDVKARAPGTSFDLVGTVSVDVEKGSVDIKIDPAGIAFGEILKNLTGLVGGNFKVEPVVGRFALRASGTIELGVVSVEVREMELSPQRVYLPEIGVKLPAAIAIGPFTVFPIGLQARLQKPVRVAIVGDASFAGLSNVVRIRSRIGVDNLPNPRIELSGTMTVVEVLDLFEMNGKIDLAKVLLVADARTIGVLGAIMPADQHLVIDRNHADLHTSIKLLLLTVKGEGHIQFSGEPSFSLAGQSNLAGLSNLKAEIASDLRLRRPAASVEGGIGLPPIGKIQFGAAASLKSVRLHASILGIRASLTLPSLGDLNGGLIKKLFEDLLKPSIDLKSLSLKNVNLALTPKIGGGGGGGGPSKGDAQKDGTDGKGGPAITPAAAGGGAPVQDPGGAVRTGSVPSEWQSGWLPSPPAPNLYCAARWKSPQQVQWTGDMRIPRAVVQFLGANRPVVYLGRVASKATFWSDCSKEVYSTAETSAVAFFDGTNAPKIWHQGTEVIEEAAWIDAALKQVGSPGAASVTATAMPSPAVSSLVRILYKLGVTSDFASSVRLIQLPNNQQFYQVSPKNSDVFYLIDVTGGAGQSRLLRKTDPLGQLVLDVIAEPAKPQAELRQSLLPLLFAGNAPVVLSDTGGSLLLAVAPFDGSPFAATFKASPPRCGGQVAVERVSEITSKTGFLEPMVAALLAEGQSCPKSARWTKLMAIVDGAGELQRVLGLQDKGAGDWSLEFVDRERACIRTGLTRAVLRQSVDTWSRDGLLQTDKAAALIGSDGGLGALLKVMRTPDMDWRAAGFPGNPGLVADCASGK